MLTFTLGLILFYVGYFLDHEKAVPVIERVIAPRDYFIRQALMRLENDEQIGSRDPAFGYLLSICPPTGVDVSTITGLVRGSTTTDYTKARPESRYGIDLVFGKQVNISPFCNSAKVNQALGDSPRFMIRGFVIGTVGFFIK